MIQYRKSWQNTARIARALINASICRAFLRSVVTVIYTRVGGSIARISQIATAAPKSETGVLAGFLAFDVSAIGAGGILASFTMVEDRSQIHFCRGRLTHDVCDIWLESA
jgi:hypothetical protein